MNITEQAHPQFKASFRPSTDFEQKIDDDGDPWGTKERLEREKREPKHLKYMNKSTMIGDWSGISKE